MSTLEEIKERTEGHTEGPLLIDDEEQTVRVGYAGEIMFDRSTESHSYWMECRPNAELIAAAPKLLAALEAALATADELIAKNQDSTSLQSWGLMVAGRKVREAITEALA